MSIISQNDFVSIQRGELYGVWQFPPDEVVENED